MEVFGPTWKGYEEKIKANWEKIVKNEDLVLIPGDICWAIKPEEALKDLDWIDKLPGEKLIIRGNHDYWWPSSSKLRGLLPPSIHFIHNNSFDWNQYTFGGTRLWDTHEYTFDPFIEFVENPKKRKDLIKSEADREKIFTRELDRLKRSLEKLSPKANKRIALVHYPPIGADLRPSRASAILEDFQIDICVFGHLHNVKKGALNFGKARGVHYIFASADYLDFTPIEVL